MAAIRPEFQKVEPLWHQHATLRDILPGAHGLSPAGNWHGIAARRGAASSQEFERIAGTLHCTHVSRI